MEFGSPEIRYAEPREPEKAPRRFRPWLCPAQADFIGHMVRCWKCGHKERHECGCFTWFDEVES